MTATRKLAFISVEDYLACEEVSPIKHEYRDGVVYAMAGARNLHNILSGNVYHYLRARLTGQTCRPFISETKIRIRTAGHVRFYYPDASVTCRPNPMEDSFQDEPAAIFEVLSDSTRRADTGEKLDAYLTIPSLAVYVLIEQESAGVVAYRRTPTGFVREVYEGLEAVIPLGEFGIELPLTEIYEGVEFSEEPENDEGKLNGGG